MAELYTTALCVGSSTTLEASEKSRWQSVASPGIERLLCEEWAFSLPSSVLRRDATDVSGVYALGVKP